LLEAKLSVHRAANRGTSTVQQPERRQVTDDCTPLHFVTCGDKKKHHTSATDPVTNHLQWQCCKHFQPHPITSPAKPYSNDLIAVARVGILSNRRLECYQWKVEGFLEPSKRGKLGGGLLKLAAT
jgi:hypothetical protein